MKKCTVFFMIISSLFISFPHLYGISDTGSRTKESDTKNGKRSDSNEKTTLTMEEYEKLQHQAAQLDQKYREQSPYLPIVINLSLLCSTIALVAVGITSHYCLEESNRKNSELLWTWCYFSWSVYYANLFLDKRKLCIALYKFL